LDTEITTSTSEAGIEMTHIRKGAMTIGLPSAGVTTYDEFLATAHARFGEDPVAWAFLCPNCGDIATGADFGAAEGRGRLGQECIGNTVEERGCDWAAYGLFAGPCAVVMPDGEVIFTFRLAPRGAVSTPMLRAAKAGAR